MLVVVLGAAQLDPGAVDAEIRPQLVLVVFHAGQGAREFLHVVPGDGLGLFEEGRHVVRAWHAFVRDQAGANELVDGPDGFPEAPMNAGDDESSRIPVQLRLQGPRCVRNAQFHPDPAT